jgi:type VI protein secretion system component VasK
MTFTRLALGAGVVVVLAFSVLMAIAVGGAFTPVVALAALFILVGAGNLLYGKHSHGAAAKARVRPAQEAQNRAIDEAQVAERAQRHEASAQRHQARAQRLQGRPPRRGNVTG